ncbi:MAG TPA: adenylyl-sulfate kinase [Eggerthellaceae bacterium]|nr:adenylyl-sulfate kinase [Eggerthellaceae bacterium]
MNGTNSERRETAQAEELQNGLLKLVACGSVDDGKSTLIGRMLYDAKLIYADQAQALELESKAGSADGELDYSLLLDGLVAEREQGITIDVAFRYFNTEKRSFIVADAPGHEEYTRNMAVGASFADLAVILIDASKGPLTQTLRHMRICALMGIRHFVFAVNKMDEVDFSRITFDRIAVRVRKLVDEFQTSSVVIIPLSAKNGDNVTELSRNMDWYEGPTLLGHLETVEVSDQENAGKFTMPVQRVCRPNSSFRGFQGTVATGHVNVGDAVSVVGRTTSAHVASLLVGSDQVQSVVAGQACTITLDDEIDISRGNVIERNSPARSGSFFTAKLLWMDDTDLLAGKNYLFKIGTMSVPGIVLSVKHKIDVNTGEHVPAERIRKNEIAECDISLGGRVAYQEFSQNRVLGSMILIDRLTNMTSGCGVIEHIIDRSDNLTWHEMDVDRGLREAHMNQHACTIWFTGLSGSGKSTLANAVERRLHAEGRYTMLLDGDNIRLGLNRNLGFEEADRIENIRRIAEVAKLMNDAGLIVLTSFISPFVRDRRNAAEIIGNDNFIEAYVSTPLEVCEQRDVKGLYKKARAGLLDNFTGVTSPYEAPVNPDITIDTSAEDVESAAERIVALLNQRIAYQQTVEE